MTALQRGFSLVETLVASATLIIFFSAISIILNMVLRNLGEARVREVAVVLAEKRLELAHNLAYEDVGVVGGIPAGSLEALETVDDNGQMFEVRTSVVYIDDPFDEVAPEDSLPTDYKRVKVSVNWDGPLAPNEPLVLMSDIAPKGVESMSGTGTIALSVFDAEGSSVANAEVRIVADSVSPSVDLTTYSDAEGEVLLPGAPICVECYEISVTKAGYSTEKTYTSTEVTNPHKPPLSVLEGEVSNISFAIDQLASLTIQTTRGSSSNYAPFSGVQMRLYGMKEIGRDDTDEPVYKFDENVTATGSLAQVTVNNLEWDSYIIELPDGSSVDFAGSWPGIPIGVSPGTQSHLGVVVAPASAHSLLVRAENGAGQPLTSAIMDLRFNDELIATKSAGLAGKPDRGQAFFPNLSGGVYNLAIFADGYETATASVSISGDAVETFILPEVLP